MYQVIQMLGGTSYTPLSEPFETLAEAFQWLRKHAMTVPGATVSVFR